MAGKAKSFIAPVVGGGALGGVTGAVFGGGLNKIGNVGQSNFNSMLDQYNTPRPDMSAEPWLGKAREQLALEQQNARQSAQANSASELAQARSQLASRGGLRGGASERLAQSNMNQGQILGQDTANQFGIQRAGLETEGAKFGQENLLKEYFGNRAAAAQLEAARGKGGRGGVVGGLGKVTGK